MKKLLFCISVLMGFYSLQAQTDGLRYQSVILNPVSQELPWEDATGNILPNTNITLRFTILNASGGQEYQETQSTTTNAYGMVDVLIGQGTPTSTNDFMDVFWDGTQKDLQVEVNINGEFSNLGSNTLLFIPYALHRDIIATGFLNIDGNTLFKNNLVVKGTTDLNGAVSINNESRTILSGTLQVIGETNIENSLNINNESEFNASGEFNVDGITRLNNTLIVEEATNLNGFLRVNNNNPTFLDGSLSVDGETNLNNQVNINNSTLSIDGPLNVAGNTFLLDDFIVEGITNLNRRINVNNGSPTNLSGSLNTQGQTFFQNTLQIIGESNLNNQLRVNNASRTILSGTLTVELATNLNNGLWVNNDTSVTALTGPLNVNGEILFGNNLTVNGNTNLFGSLAVNNIQPTILSGNLGVGGNTILAQKLWVEDETTFNNPLTVENGAQTLLTGNTNVNGATTLNNDLLVTNSAATIFQGTLAVDEITTLNSTLLVENAVSSNLSGTLTVTGLTTLNNDLLVTNASNTILQGKLGVNGISNVNNLNVNNTANSLLSGNFTVEGISNLNNALNVLGATTINNDLTVTGQTSLQNLNSSGIAVTGDNAGFIASFSNLNQGNGDGILIKLGKNHGAWTGSNFLNLTNPLPSYLNNARTTLATRLANPTNPSLLLSVNDIIALSPSAMTTSAISNINNYVFNQFNNGVGLPIAFPDLNLPGRVLGNEIVFYGGNSRRCSGQNCFSVCIPFAGCYRVCVPPVNVCLPSIPRIAFPGVNLPTIPLDLTGLPNPSNYIPRLPITLPTGGLENVQVPLIPVANVSNSLSKENEYFTFQDKDGRKTGSIRAQSLTDFRDNTILDNVFVLNLLSDFVGIDLVDGITAGAVGVTNYIEDYNKLGVEYSSGNGDYAEWLERINVDESLSPGDIVGVIRGKVSKNIENATQWMVVSHRPIILGKAPQASKAHLGNSIAFMGQVPVKVLGPVKTGDYIVARSSIKGYGTAIAPKDMKIADFEFVVGRAWEENLKDGFKMVNTVIGVNDYDFAETLDTIENQQNQLDNKLTTLEDRLKAINKNLNISEQKQRLYASEK